MPEPLRDPRHPCPSRRRRIPVRGHAGPAARSRLPCHDRHHDARRLRQRGARCRDDRGDPARGGTGVGLADRGGLRCLEFRDLAIFNDDESRRRVTEALRRTRPDIILTAPPVDYIADHEMTSLLVRDACFARLVPQLRDATVGARAPAAPDSASLFRRSARGERPRGASGARSISRRRLPRLRHQAAMLACHASQRNWLLRQHGIDEYLEMQARWGASRGAEIGVDAGRGVPAVSRPSLSPETTSCSRPSGRMDGTPSACVDRGERSPGRRDPQGMA